MTDRPPPDFFPFSVVALWGLLYLSYSASSLALVCLTHLLTPAPHCHRPHLRSHSQEKGLADHPCPLRPPKRPSLHHHHHHLQPLYHPHLHSPTLHANPSIAALRRVRHSRPSGPPQRGQPRCALWESLRGRR